MKTPEKLIFPSAVEGLVNSLQGSLSTPLKQRFKQHGLDVEKPLLPAYDFEVWHRVLHEVVVELWPQLPLDEGYRQLGRQLVLGYRQTLVGKALEVIAKLIGPQRMLARMDKNIRGGDNHTRIEFTLVSPGKARLDVTDSTAYPTYFCGIFEAAAELAGGRQVTAIVVKAHPPGALFEVEWQ